MKTAKMLTFSRFAKPSLGKSPIWLIGTLGIVNLLFAKSAIAHHPFGNEVPDNFLTGFLSGLGHPVIGLDHLAFVVATGLLATFSPQGFAIPIAFCLTAMAGTGLHLLELNLPLTELCIAFSVLAFGVLLVLRQIPHWTLLAALGAIAGIFHGYAYGEAVIGAQMNPIIAYLLGFTFIQSAIALAAWALGQWVNQHIHLPKFTPLQLAGFAITAMGTIFLTTAI